MKVAERIQNLGGTPVDDEGVIGSVQGFVNQLMLPELTGRLIESALNGEAYGHSSFRRDCKRRLRLRKPPVN